MHLPKFSHKLAQSQGVRQSALVALGNVGASGFSAISLIILSRYLGPVNFGSFSVAFALTQLIARLADMGLNVSMQRIIAAEYSRSPAKAAAAIRLVGWLKLATAGMAIVIGLAAGPLIGTHVLHMGNPVLPVLGISLAAIIILYEYVLGILQALAKFLASVVVNAVQAGLKCILAVFSLMFLAPSAEISYLWYGLTPVIAVLVGWLSIPQPMKGGLKPVNISEALFTTAKFASVAVIAAAIGDNIDILMVKSWLTEYQTGLYAAAARVALMITLVGLSIGTVLNTRVAQYRSEKHLKTFLTKALVFAGASLAATPVVLYLSQPLLLITAGPEFAGAVESLNYLMVSALFTMAMMPYMAVFFAVDYPQYFAVAGVIQTVILILGNTVLIPILGIEGAALAKMATRFLVMVYTMLTALAIAKRQYQVKAPTFTDIKQWLAYGSS